MASFFAPSTAAGESGTFSQVAGQETTLDIIPAFPSPDTVFDIQTQLSDGTWRKVAQLTAASPSGVLSSAGTFRLYRYPCAVAAGVDKT